MRGAPRASKLAAMLSSTTRRLTIEASVDDSVIRGALIAPSGYRREFHGWLELNTALEAMLDTGRVVDADLGQDQCKSAGGRG
jgi:hypothetical protein